MWLSWWTNAVVACYFPVLRRFGLAYPATLKALELLEQREALPLGNWFVRGNYYDKLDRT